MSRFPTYRLAAIAALTLFSWQAAELPAQQGGLPPLGGPEAPSALEQLETELGYTELTRGPVHEAFAEQVSLDPQPGIIVGKEPPLPIVEVPPENQPSGANVTWIDGYWAFSEDDDDFIWVSGAWRDAPRGYQWVPGHWNKVDTGYQWIGGFWATADRADVEYLPTPPETLEEGPTSAAPGDGYFWIPGNWEYGDSSYAWRPGYWAQSQQNYVWIPQYYRWTPSGCILAGGYWDYPLASRGYLFAPIQFNRPVYRTQGWYYTPRVALNLGPLLFHLFVRPSYSHYYFGDYYGNRYANNGWFAWQNYYGRRHAYDPLFAYNVSRYRQRGIDFNDRSRRWHNYFEEHKDHRPPHTFKKQKEYIAQHRDRDDIKTVSLGDSFDDVVRNKQDKFVRMDDNRRSQVNDMRQRFSKLRDQRTQLEVAGNQVRRSGEERSNRDGRDGRSGDDGRNFPRFKLRDGDEVRALRPNLDNNASRGQFNGRTREDQGQPRDLTPNSRPRASATEGRGQSLQDRINEAQRQRQSQQFQERRSDDGPRINNSPAREDKPQKKPSSGGLIRPDTNPRGENRFSPSPERRENSSPTPIRRPTVKQNDSPTRTFTPQRNSNSSENRPSFRSRNSGGNNRQSSGAFSSPGRSGYQSSVSSQSRFQSNSNRGSFGGGSSNRGGSNQGNFSRGNSNRGHSGSGNSGRGHGRRNK